eukprot:GHVO01059441.1.p1 GENE.GHVO01059441.1~~GHVO01059441.1.p1  ORF type:complete len:461 (+),score=42.92 GHVO01059441.1:26-1384(+)
MSEKYELNFHWPHPEPNSVTVSGTFDQWSRSLHLAKGEDGHRGKTEVKWGEKVLYKYIVDGNWAVDTQKPTEIDPAGNVNNVFTTSAKPAGAFHPNGNGTINESKPTSESTVGKLEIQQGTSGRIFPQLVSDFATTIAATDGTSSAFNYVVSGVGAAIQGVIGLDPINPDQMSVKSPISPVPPTPNVDTALVEESSPTSVSAKAKSAAEDKVISDIPTPDETELAAAPSVEPSTHTPVTPVTPAVLSPSEPPVESLPADTLSTPAIEASTHIPIAVPVKSDVSLNPFPSASATDVVASELTPAPAVETVSEPIVEVALASSVPIVGKSSAPTAEDAKVAEPEVSTAVETNVSRDLPSETVPTPAPVAAEQTASTAIPEINDDSASSTKDRSATPTPSAPSTPSKRSSRAFPSFGSTNSSPASSKFGSSRKKRTSSIFGKVKHIFLHHKEEEK